MIRAIEKYSKNLPKSLKYTQEVLHLQATESGKMRAALSGEWLVEWDMKHYFETSVGLKGKNYNKPWAQIGHCDYKGKIEKYAGQIKFLNKVERDGYYLVDVSAFDSLQTFPKTFFPKSWMPKKTFEVICEALKDAKPKKTIGLVGEKFLVTGFTKDGAKLEFVVLRISKNQIKIITVYPCKNWISETFNQKNN